MSNNARMTIDVPKEFKNEIKSHAALLGKNLKDYVVEAIQVQLARDEIKTKEKLEDEILGKIADKAKKEGFISDEESKKLLEKLRNL